MEAEHVLSVFVYRILLLGKTACPNCLSFRLLVLDSFKVVFFEKSLLPTGTKGREGGDDERRLIYYHLTASFGSVMDKRSVRKERLYALVSNLGHHTCSPAFYTYD